MRKPYEEQTINGFWASAELPDTSLYVHPRWIDWAKQKHIIVVSLDFHVLKYIYVKLHNNGFRQIAEFVQIASILKNGKCKKIANFLFSKL